MADVGRVMWVEPVEDQRVDDWNPSDTWMLHSEQLGRWVVDCSACTDALGVSRAYREFDSDGEALDEVLSHRRWHHGRAKEASAVAELAQVRGECVPRGQLGAMVRMLAQSGDVSAAGARMLGKL